MKKYFILISMLVLSAGLSAQNELDSNFAIYKGDSLSYLLQAPEDWILDLENAQFDGKSAFFCPDDMDYFTAKLGINIWIYKLDSLSFRDFIAADSLAYIKSDSTIRFDKVDSIIITDKQKAIVLRTKEPGPFYSLAMVAYIDAGAEIVIYELNISASRFYLIAAVKFEESLKKFSFVK